MNISKETTAQELAKIKGVSEGVRRAVGINLSGGFVNAVEICVKVYGAPNMDQMLASFEAHLQGVDVLNVVGTGGFEEEDVISGDAEAIDESEELDVEEAA